jgi:uncharacterized protein
MKKLILLALFIAMHTIQLSAQPENSYKATLKKMLEVAGSGESFKAAINQMFTMFKQQESAVPDSVWASMEGEFLNTSMDELVDMLTPVYQSHITESDLTKIIEFYQTPVGKKFAEKTPLIMQESMQVGQQWGMKIGNAFQEKLKAKGY